MEYSLSQQRNWEIFVDFFWFKSVNSNNLAKKIKNFCQIFDIKKMKNKKH
jgi:hypothetical protein